MALAASRPALEIRLGQSLGAAHTVGHYESMILISVFVTCTRNSAAENTASSNPNLVTVLYLCHSLKLLIYTRGVRRLLQIPLAEETQKTAT
jgi:hypothetical protein